MGMHTISFLAVGAESANSGPASGTGGAARRARRYSGRILPSVESYLRKSRNVRLWWTSRRWPDCSS